MKNNKMNFTAFISGLMAEGMVALGLMKNPVTQKTRKEMVHADMVVDTLTMLKEKTAGNLTDEESGNLGAVLHQLRMMYVAETGKASQGEG